jgi:dienelactone hydrolase
MTNKSMLAVCMLPIIAVSVQAQTSNSRSAFKFAPVNELPVHKGMPDPFTKPDGTRLKSKKDWPAQRVYLKAMLAHYQYGTMPPRPKQFDLARVDSKPIMVGKAIQERYAITLARNNKKMTFHFELIRPKEGERLPTIVKNCSVYFKGQGRSKKTADRDMNAAIEAVRRGYLLCKFDRTEVAADRADNRKAGVFPLYPEYDWATIAAWAWAHGVVVDALDRLKLVDTKRIVATGHSRGGKTAMCAGIYDERVAITAPNSSGTGGTGSLRYFEKGQKEQRLILHKTQFPHWWVHRFSEFGGKEERLPYDAHTAKSLIAPRALINAHARQDYWANPLGTELTYQAADKVFDWLGAKGKQGIHWRDGGHAQGQEDWLALLDFADWQFFKKKPNRRFSTLAYPKAKVPITWNVP